MDEVMALIVTETSMDLADEFAAIVVDSLLSLVQAERFRDKLGIEVKSSPFIESANIAALEEWLSEYT
jgi:monodictyphenone polyketide synthase